MKFCINCGQQLEEDWIVCPKCGTRVGTTLDTATALREQGPIAPVGNVSAPAGAAVSTRPPRATSGSAVASLVLGILWIWGIGSLLAVLLGFRARSQIKRSNGAVGGNGLAVAGITLGIVGVIGAVVLTLALVGLNETITRSAPQVRTQEDTPNANDKTSVARIGSAIQLSAANNAKLSVTAQQVIDPASGANEFSTPESGKRFVGVKFVISNVGSGTYNGNANNGASVIGSDGQTYTTDFNAIAGCTNFNNGDITLAPEGASTGCVVFQIPNGVTVAKVRFNPNSGLSGETGEWTNR